MERRLTMKMVMVWLMAEAQHSRVGVGLAVAKSQGTGEGMASGAQMSSGVKGRAGQTADTRKEGETEKMVCAKHPRQLAWPPAPALLGPHRPPL